MTEVKIRSLEWEHPTHSWNRYARAIVGIYCISESSPTEFYIDLDGRGISGWIKSLDEAKAAAQTHFETCIRRAILPDVSGAEAVSKEPPTVGIGTIVARVYDEVAQDGAIGALMAKGSGMAIMNAMHRAVEAALLATPTASDLREESGLAKALRWIVQNPHAHPMNIHRVALDALKDANLAPSDALLTLQTEGK